MVLATATSVIFWIFSFLPLAPLEDPDCSGVQLNRCGSCSSLPAPSLLHCLWLLCFWPLQPPLPWAVPRPGSAGLPDANYNSTHCCPLDPLAFRAAEGWFTSLPNELWVSALELQFLRVLCSHGAWWVLLWCSAPLALCLSPWRSSPSWQHNGSYSKPQTWGRSSSCHCDKIQIPAT